MQLSRQSVHFTAETSTNGVLERDFTVGEVPGVLWSSASGSDHAPLILMGHGGGQHKKTPALLARAHHLVTTRGFTVVAVDAPGHGDRPRTAEDEQARADLQRAHAAGDPLGPTSARYGTALAKRAVPEWRATLDALQELPEIGADAPIGYGGGVTLGTAIGVPLTAVEPRINAAVFGGGFVVHETLLDAARQVTVPVLFLLQWDDEHVERGPLWGCSTPSPRRRRPCTRTPAGMVRCRGSSSTTRPGSWSGISAGPGRHPRDVTEPAGRPPAVREPGCGS